MTGLASLYGVVLLAMSLHLAFAGVRVGVSLFALSRWVW